jgi:hypothetical protein
MASCAKLTVSPVTRFGGHQVVVKLSWQRCCDGQVLLLLLLLVVVVVLLMPHPLRGCRGARAWRCVSC